MNLRLAERLAAGAVFLYALLLYLFTVAPTASFWDAGEFIAIAHGLQVSHPPGAPFYMLWGRLFSMFAPADQVALAVNLVSVFASAFTVLLTHLSIVRLVRLWQTEAEEHSATGRGIALAGGAVGALAFAATDSFWFNAVEAEVYAMSMLFTAAVVWLVLRWQELARAEEALLGGTAHPFGLSANRYLVLIAYLFGLAIGVHLLNLLALFFIALIFYFAEIERPHLSMGQIWKGIILTGVVSVALFLIVYPGVVQWLPDIAGRTNATLTLLAVVGLSAFAIYYTQRHHMQAANLVAVSIAVLLIGYSTYALIFIRSAANPPIDENDPETTEAIVSYLKREQYGSTPLLKGASYDNNIGAVNPDDIQLFPRRYSPDPSHMRVYARYNSDWDFFWKYQVGHMYVRYFLWNFVGRAADTQDAPAITGLFPGETDHILYQTPSERAGRNAYYALPLLIGLVGAGFHFSRDWRRAFSVLMLFLLTGIGIIVYLNQTPIQPRERDYSYVASFFAFALWIGLGASGTLQYLREALAEKLSWSEGRAAPVLGLAAVVLFCAAPLLLTIENYDDHDRSGQYAAPDYAYNMLQSAGRNGILFTNGDNDTFPLWYAQEVEGVRTDVRVVNLSLLNTPWYIKQLKNQASHESEPLPISLTDEQIERVEPVAWQPQTIRLPVDPAAFRLPEGARPLPDTVRLQNPMEWTMTGRPYNQEMNWLHVADQLALNIVQTNAEQGWKRPISFAVTVSQDSQLDLQNYFQLEGQALRVVPVRHDVPLGRVAPEAILPNLKQFRFRNLNDPDVYYDENIRRMVDNYRNIFSHTAEQLAQQGLRRESIALLDTLQANVPYATIPGDERSFYYVARAYEAAGAYDKAAAVWKIGEPVFLHTLKHARDDREAEFISQFIQIMRMTYMEAGDFEAAAALTDRMAEAFSNPTLKRTPQQLRQEFEAAARDSSAP